MKRLILTLILCLSVAIGVRADIDEWNGVSTVTGIDELNGLVIDTDIDEWNQIAIDAVDYSSIISFINLEGTWTANPCTADGDYDADSAGECGFDTEIYCSGDVAKQTVSPLVGTNSADVVDTQRYFRIEYPSNGHADGAVFAKGQFCILVDPSGTIPADSSLAAGMIDTDPDNVLWLRFDAGNKLDVVLEDGGTDKLGLSLETDTSDFHTTTHFVCVAWDFTVGAGSDYVKLYVDGVEEDVGDSDDLTVSDTWSIRFIYAGNYGTNDPVQSWIWDNHIVSNDPTADLSALSTATTKPTGACP